MSQSATPDRGDVLEMLASLGQRSVDEVAEQIGSLELAWLVTKVESRYDVTLDLSDEMLAQMTTVSTAVTTLREVLAGAEHG